jgi:CheY-like chemotaxis protein
MPVLAVVDNSAAAVDAVTRFDAEAVLAEIQLPVALGWETVAALRAAHPRPNIVVCASTAGAPPSQPPSRTGRTPMSSTGRPGHAELLAEPESDRHAGWTPMRTAPVTDLRISSSRHPRR